MTKFRAALLPFLCCLGLMSGCTRKTAPPPTGAEATGANGVKTGRPELQFDYLATTEVTLRNANPLEGERWSTRIRKRDNPFQPGAQAWFIESAPEGEHLGDVLANGSFFLHLLDTVRTLTVVEAPFSGALESFGLAPPWYDLRWKVAGSSQEHELALGSPAKALDGSFAGLYGKILEPEVPNVFMMNGAMLKMLELLPDFNAVRLQKLATFDSDDVDVIEIFSGAKMDVGSRRLYAQRDGDHWANATHRPFSQDLPGWLDQLTHLRIEHFIDDRGERARHLKQVSDHTLFTLRFQGRNLKPLILKIAQGHRKAESFTLATLSSRRTDSQLSVFQVYPQALSMILPVLRK